MEEDKERFEEAKALDREEIFSKAVRAGKRTYFFDVKATKRDDYYLTITESKKRYNKDGRFFYEKHKIFLYKEDFEKFSDQLQEALGFINELNASQSPIEDDVKVPEAESALKDYTDVEFEDLEQVSLTEAAETK